MSLFSLKFMLLFIRSLFYTGPFLLSTFQADTASETNRFTQPVEV